MTVRSKAPSNSLTRIKQDYKQRDGDATPSLRTETTAPCSDEEGSPGKPLRVKVKVRKSTADHHRSLNALELEHAIRTLQTSESNEKKASRTTTSDSDSHSQLIHALERLHQSFPGDVVLEDVSYENIVRKTPTRKSSSVSRRRSTTPRDRSTRTSHALLDPPATPRSSKSSQRTRQSSSSRRGQSASPLRKPGAVPHELRRSMSPKRILSPTKRTEMKTPSTPVRLRSESSTRGPSRTHRNIEPKERRSVSRTRSNQLEYFTPADVAFPDPWADVRIETLSSDSSRVNDLVLQSGIITANQLKQLLNAGFTFNGPEFLDAFP